MSAPGSGKAAVEVRCPALCAAREGGTAMHPERIEPKATNKAASLETITTQTVGRNRAAARPWATKEIHQELATNDWVC